MGFSKLYQFFCGRLDFSHVYNLRKFKFLLLLSASSNSIVSECYTFVGKSKSFQDLLSLYTLSVFDSQFMGYVSSIVYNTFADLCVTRL